MRQVILAMPRSGSTWVSSYFGFLHDPLMQAEWHDVVGHSIVDTGAAYNAEKVYNKYRECGYMVSLLLRSPEQVFMSLARTNRFPHVSLNQVQDWYVDLFELKSKYGLDSIWYEDFLGESRRPICGWALCGMLGREYDATKWDNYLTIHVENDLGVYTQDNFKRYAEWVDAPPVR